LKVVLFIMYDVHYTMFVKEPFGSTVHRCLGYSLATKGNH
jgi:hypothetical protein